MCHCDKEKKYVNCGNQNLNKLFSEQQWNALANASGDALDTVMYVNHDIISHHTIDQ